MTKLQYGFITLFLGLSLLGLNLAPENKSFIGVWGAVMLLFVALWDFCDHYAELKSKADVNEIS